MDTTFDAPRTARKIKRQLKADRPKVIGLSIVACLVAPLPYAGTWAALAAGLLAFWLIAKGFMAMHKFEMDMDDAGVPEAETDRLMPKYQPLMVTAGVCLASLIAAAVISSKLAGMVAELMGVVA